MGHRIVGDRLSADYSLRVSEYLAYFEGMSDCQVVRSLRRLVEISVALSGASEDRDGSVSQFETRAIRGGAK